MTGLDPISQTAKLEELVEETQLVRPQATPHVSLVDIHTSLPRPMPMTVSPLVSLRLWLPLLMLARHISTHPRRRPRPATATNRPSRHRQKRRGRRHNTISPWPRRQGPLLRRAGCEQEGPRLWYDGSAESPWDVGGWLGSADGRPHVRGQRVGLNDGRPAALGRSLRQHTCRDAIPALAGSLTAHELHIGVPVVGYSSILMVRTVPYSSRRSRNSTSFTHHARPDIKTA
mmetsp:Transcript_38496/g.110080  ORF Transcript_38496/g.110080 Transcript_38496/m.110080 type:complete len:230 (-) Transcript_38496:597-1286(-)